MDGEGFYSVVEVARLVDAARCTRDVMNAKEAAELLRMPESEFRRIAPDLPRHTVSERRYVYLHSELLDWLRER